MKKNNDIFGQVVDFYKKRYMDMAGINPPGEYPSFREMVSRLVSVSDYEFAVNAFLHDPLHGKIDDVERDRILNISMEEGRVFARELMEQHGALTPEQLANAIGIQIKRPFVPEKGGRVLFAEFEEPSEIRIYQDSIGKFMELLLQYEVKEIAGEDLEQILIGHELYHWVEEQHKSTIFSLNYQFTNWNFWGIKGRSHLPVLSEIAAMSFSKTLAGISFSPYVLDILLAYGYNHDFAGSLYLDLQETLKKIEMKKDF